MVRTTIACMRCRKAKTKCIHDGSPPCQSCIKEGSANIVNTCVLTGPILKRKKLLASRETGGGHKTPTGISASRNSSIESQAVSVVRTQRRASCSPYRQRETSSQETPNRPQREFIHRVVKAANAFVVQFPELNFLHIPSFLNKLKDLEGSPADILGQNDAQNDGAYHGSKLRGLCFALLALCGPWLKDEYPREEYASSARSSISAGDAPDIFTVQTLLVLAMYEWGRGSTYRAWADSGMAIRSVQLLSATPKPRDATELQGEIQNRTFWACFVMDRLVFCGKPQPLALPLLSVEAHWPVGQRDYAFGHISSLTYPKTGRGATMNHTQFDDLDRVYFLLVQGYDIWSKILQWIAGGGRRRPPSARQQTEAPWADGSTWRSLYDELQGWRGQHGTSIRFPDTAVEVHVSLGQAHGFAYLNLIYHLCRLFLGREYIPFLPTPTSEPSGPADPPLLTQEAPSGWWEDRAHELFSSSAHITHLLRRLDAADASFSTPFSGFCAFSAATMNVYVLYFPRMNLGRSPNAAADVDADRDYFDRFCTHWPIGARWWTTIETARRLYEKASRDRARFSGKTRIDFLALEAAIHHGATTCSFPSEMDTNAHAEPRDHQRDLPATPAGDGAANCELENLGGNHSVPEAIGLRHPNESQSQPQPQPQSQQGLELYYDGSGNEWNAIWPLWEDQLGISFSLESIPWEYAASSATAV
ncbi:hypothetical protein V8C37DRAFT_92584 [Trichoderma ceciliae]